MFNKIGNVRLSVVVVEGIAGTLIRTGWNGGRATTTPLYLCSVSTDIHTAAAEGEEVEDAVIRFRNISPE